MPLKLYGVPFNEPFYICCSWAHASTSVLVVCRCRSVLNDHYETVAKRSLM